jgi:hypothetical protein
MIRTNANGGATISYFAELDTTGAADNHRGTLKVIGSACNAGNVSTDRCFDAAGATQVAMTGERFGMTSSSVLRPTGSTTTNLTRDTDYDGDGTVVGSCTAGTIDSPNCWSWVESGANTPAETLATSSTVLDYEMLVLRFAARAAATTPTGSYAVTSTYIATSVF